MQSLSSERGSEKRPMLVGLNLGGVGQSGAGDAHVCCNGRDHVAAVPNSLVMAGERLVWLMHFSQRKSSILMTRQAQGSADLLPLHLDL